MTDRLLYFWHVFDQAMQFSSSEDLISAFWDFSLALITAYFVVGFPSFSAAYSIVGC